MIGGVATRQMRPEPSPVYRPRNPQDSAYYRCVEDHFETFGHLYEERFEKFETSSTFFSVPNARARCESSAPLRTQRSSSQKPPSEDCLYKQPEYPMDAYIS